MFLVLVVHADFWALGRPDNTDFLNEPLGAWTRVIIQAVSIVCVNVFILISGWFGIKPSLKGFIGFIFQCLYFSLGIYIFILVIGRQSITATGISQALCLLPTYWFVTAYIGLYILAPILNHFLSHANNRLIGTTLLIFYIFQTLYGWIGHATFIDNGFSTFSFVGLYLTSGYVRKLNLRHFKWSSIYVVCVITLSMLYYLQISFSSSCSLYLFAYINPIIVVESLSLFMLFKGFNIKSNQYLNWIAKSAFAVYLLHTNQYLAISCYKKACLEIFNNYNNLSFMVVISISLIMIFSLSILIDQPRIYIWNKISDKTCTLINYLIERLIDSLKNFITFNNQN